MRLTRLFLVTLITLAFAGAASAQRITAQQSDEILKEVHALRRCSQGTTFDSAISKDMTEGAGVSVTGTPTFFVGKTTTQGFEGFRIVGAQPYAVFQPRIEGLLK